MNVTNYHTQACMDVWLNCENLLISLQQRSTTYSKRTVQVVVECADICLTALQALKAKCKNLGELALLCIGICEECAEICERYDDSLFKNCAAICRHCSTAFTPIALSDQ
jgi:hypothetical protein